MFQKKNSNCYLHSLPLLLGIELLVINPISTANAKEILPNNLQLAQAPAQAFWPSENLFGYTSPNALVTDFYFQKLLPQQLGEGDNGCFIAKSSRVSKSTDDSILVVLRERGSCDDSVSGQLIQVTMVADGNQWQVTEASVRSHCRGEYWAKPGERCP